MPLLVRPTRLLGFALDTVSPSQSLEQANVLMLFLANRYQKPGPKGPILELIHVDRRNEAA
jgi:hypothetical protein